MPTQQTPTPDVKPTDWEAMAALASDDITDVEAEALVAAMAGERETCDHPESERFTHDFGQGGYLNKPKGERILCSGCGADHGASR